MEAQKSPTVMADDIDVYSIRRTRETPEIAILPPFVALRKKRKKQQESDDRKRRSTFKENFLKRFKLDEDRFSINLIRKDGKWFVEIYNRKTKNRVYQDYDTVCNILDIDCKLHRILGVNIDQRG